MKVVTPEISWHGKDAIFSIDVQASIKGQPKRLATAGLDSNVRIWHLKKSEVKFLSNLSRHEKAVNVVRFSKKSLMIASGGDDGTVVIWKLVNGKEDVPNIFGPEEGENKEVWNAFKILRGHLEDINDLSWSSDDVHLVSGSVDHTAIVWDVEKMQKLAIFSDSKHFVNGVAWDPLGRYIATMSCDRSLRIYNISNKKLVHCVSKMVYNKSGAANDGSSAKSQRIFHDETVVRRRLSFTVDGKLLITPAGCLQPEASSQQVNTAMIFSRNQLSRPCVFLPGLLEAASVVSCCPVLFELRPSEKAPMFKLDYRHIFAVASNDSVIFYDTQQSTPFALISNIHYASITDLSWSSDASFLAVSSRDGFCSIIYFDELELGKPVVATSSSANVLQAKDNVVTNKQALDAVCGEVSSIPQIVVKESNKTLIPDELGRDDVESMEMESNCDLPPELEKEHADSKTKVNSDVKLKSNSPKPRRVLLQTVSSTPGGESPLAEKVISAKHSCTNGGPRRVHLTPVQK